MKKQSTNQIGQRSVDPVSLFLPLTKSEKTDIARQASVARGWLVGLRVRP